MASPRKDQLNTNESKNENAAPDEKCTDIFVKGKYGYHHIQMKYINQVDGNGHTPLTYAVAHNHEEFAKKLIECKADVNQIDEFGNNAFLLACYNGNENLAKLLLDHKATYQKNSLFGQSPRSMASLWGNKKILELLDSIYASGSESLMKQKP